MDFLTCRDGSMTKGRCVCLRLWLSCSRRFLAQAQDLAARPCRPTPLKRRPRRKPRLSPARTSRASAGRAPPQAGGAGSDQAHHCARYIAAVKKLLVQPVTVISIGA